MKPGVYDYWYKKSGDYIGRTRKRGKDAIELEGFKYQWAHGLDECPEMPEEPLEDGWYVWRRRYTGDWVGVLEKIGDLLYRSARKSPEYFGKADDYLAVSKFSGPPEEV
jgi:hypothetical protein